MNKIAAVSLCLILGHPVAALACNTPRDVAALKTAALHQRLMVAALTCKSSTAYNRFVLANRAELQRSDADLKAYFVAQGSEAAYDTYKTKVANLAAHGPAVDARAFCAATADEFQALSAAPDSLSHALAVEKLPANVCKAPMLTAAATRPVAKRVAAEEVAGVAGAMPAMPYSAAPPPVARMVREEEPIDPADILPPASYAENARDEERVEPAENYAPPRMAYAPSREASEPADDYAPPRMAYAPGREAAERYDDYAPPPPRYARDARRGERYWYYRDLYARPRSTWRD